MKEKDEITGLFHSRLAGAEMTVREGFWETLQEGVSRAEAAGNKVPPMAVASPAGTPSATRKATLLSPGLYRVAAAASVVLVLGAASAAFWYFSPKEEIKEAFTQVAALTPEGNLNGDVVQESFPSIHQAEPTAQKPGMKYPVNGGIPAGMAAQAEEDDESVSVRVSITITQRVYGNQQQGGNGFFNNHAVVQNGYQTTADQVNTNRDTSSATSPQESQSSTSLMQTLAKSHKWALKAAIGSSLPKGDYCMPLTAGITVERRLNKTLALETGILYNRLQADRTLHTLGIPVKLNVMLASTPKVDLYATVGGAAEKCIAGAADNGFGAEPVRLSVAAGVGVRYKLNDRFALFAEPSVSHHFDTDSGNRSLRTERPTNLNLLCGVRMTY